MRCYTCNSDNPSSAFYCSQCGAPIRSAAKPRTESPSRPPRAVDRNLLVYGGTAFLVLSLALLVFLSISGRVPQETEQGAVPEPASTLDRPAAARSESTERQQAAVIAGGDFGTENAMQGARAAARKKPAAAESSEPAPPPPPPLLIGTAQVTNPWDYLLAELPTAVSRDGWLAMPMAAMLGGRTLTFRGSAVGAVNVDRGLWRSGDPVGLWRLDSEAPLNSPELRIWSEALPLSWQSLQPGAAAVAVQVQPVVDLGLFIRCQLPPEITAPGVLLQDGRIVGWTFGAWDPSGYLWDGDTTAVRSTTTMANYYRQTFQGGREEQFAQALAMEGTAALGDRIAAFAEGFLRQPKLSEEQTPVHIRKDAVSRYLTFLVAEAMQQGLERQVAASLTLAVLKAAEDPTLPGMAVNAVLAVSGYEEAIHIAAEMADHFAQRNPAAARQLDVEEARLYLDYLRILRDDGNTRYGWRIWDEARRAFPENLAIHLIGVELALADGNWPEAERLLYRYEYPPELTDKADLLAARISEMKGQEGKIVIRFTPGSHFIPVEATLNGRVRQRFLIDTGASFVTIPKATLDKLGLRVSASDPTHRVSTAGGVMQAKSVVLSSIEIGGWTVDNLAVLVLDIPDQPGTGLLGLNFLSRFRMDLQSDNGILTLSPR